MNLLRIFDRHPHDDLSAYADGQLGWKQGERLEQHLESCTACSDELASVRALRSALSDLTEARAPRSFALTPAQVAAPAPERQYAGPSPAFIAMRVAGAGVAAVLALVVVIDSGGGGTETGSDDMTALQYAESDDADRSGGDSAPAAGSAPEPDGSENFTIEATDAAADSAGEDGSQDPVEGQGAGGATDLNVETPPEMAVQSPDEDNQPGNINVDKSVNGITADEAARDNEVSPLSTSDDDGVSTLLIIEIALGIIAVGGIAGGFVLPLFVRKND